MKKIPFLTFLFLAITFSIYGQQTKRDQIKALKVAFITEKLDLNSIEAEKFWPIYNRYIKKNRQLRKYRNKIITVDIKNELNDNQANEKLQQLVIIEKQQYQNKIELIDNLKKFFSPQKIIKLFFLEKAFNKKLLKRLKHY